LLRRENALLQRELQLERNGNGVAVNAPTTSAVRIKDVSDMLAYFNGDRDTFDTWKRQAEILQTTYRLDENAIKILLSSRLKGKAQVWYHSTPTHLQLPVNELFEQMDRMFNQRRTRLELRRNFEKRVWQVGKSFATYFHAKIILANKASIAREKLTDYLIDGIPDYRMRDQARMQRFQSEENLLEAFANLSLPSYDKGPQRKGEEKTEKVDRQRSKEKEEPKSKMAASQENRLRCYNCSEFGHVSKDCGKPTTREKGSCFRCGSKAHQVQEK